MLSAVLRRISRSDVIGSLEKGAFALPSIAAMSGSCDAGGISLDPEMQDKKISFIGAGRMAEALARGIVRKGIVKADDIFASDILQERRSVFGSFGANVSESNQAVVEKSDIVFLSVKPWFIKPVLQEIRSSIKPEQVIVSIAAGITMQGLMDIVGPDTRLIRVMPNTPCLVGESAAAMCLGGNAEERDAKIVRQLLRSVGIVYEVDEKLIGAVTSLSGSGPAYVFLMIEALSDGGVRAGLPRDMAQHLAAQTVLGAAKMVLETEESPGSLKDKVASPAGTTIAGLHELERAGVRAGFMNAVYAAKQRSDELANS